MEKKTCIYMIEITCQMQRLNKCQRPISNVAFNNKQGSYCDGVLEKICIPH